MIHHVPDRRLVPPDPPDPYADCWYCNEGLYPDRDNDIEVIEGEDREYYCCMSKRCLEAIGIEEGWDEDYEDLDDDYTFAEYVRNRGCVVKHIMTKAEEEMLKAEG